MISRWWAENFGWRVVGVRYAPVAGPFTGPPGVGEMTGTWVGSTISWPGIPLGSPVKLPVEE